MRKDFDPATVAPDGRSAAKARLFDPGADRPWRGNVEGATLNTRCTLLAYGNDIPGTGPQLHVHPYDEIFIIVAGNARFFVGDAIIDATAGEVVFGPAGVPHRFDIWGPVPYKQSTFTRDRSGCRPTSPTVSLSLRDASHLRLDPEVDVQAALPAPQLPPFIHLRKTGPSAPTGPG